MNTVQVTFAEQFIPDYDPLYTYQTADDLQEGQLVYVKGPNGVSTARVVKVDAEFNHTAVEKFNGLSTAYAEEPK